jgi:hypothetical protein
MDIPDPMTAIGDEIEIAELEQRHRDTMLDLILAWGSLDNAFGMLLSAVLGKPLDEGAQEFSRLPSSEKLQRVCRVLRGTPQGTDAARKLRRLKNRLEKHSKIRNRIAHSHCLGTSAADSRYIVFLPFERFAQDQLVCEQIPIEQMESAIEWARSTKSLVLRLEEVFLRRTA